MSWKTKWTTDEIWPVPEWWPLLENDPVSTWVQEIHETIRLWMEATRAHGQVTKCMSLRKSEWGSTQIRHCDTCQRNWNDPLYTWKLTLKMNSYGEEVELNAPGLAVPSR